MSISTQIASDLLAIHAVKLQPTKPFTWASGIISPIYCDNRVTISYPTVRRHLVAGFIDLIESKFPEATVIAGTATAGIPHAAFIAQAMNLPMVYIRTKPKDHGTGQQIEGNLPKDAKVVVIDDLISTGGSVLKAVEAAQAAGAEILGVAAIFSYRLPQATTNFATANLPYYSLTNYETLINTALEEGTISETELASLTTWRLDPENWQAN